MLYGHGDNIPVYTPCMSSNCGKKTDQLKRKNLLQHKGEHAESPEKGLKLRFGSEPRSELGPQATLLITALSK